ncbi:MAG: flagellar basal-body rod protein FlgG [bacterium]|nr:flagellar basal-body rod protein FlgG [bacterium]
MIRSLWISASGMEAQTLNIDVISNNLANVNTTGFKRSRADFQDLLYQTLRPAGASSSLGTQVPTGIELGQGARAVAVQKLFLQGDYQKTENELDLAIEGDGFFQVIKPNGEMAYTRSGALKLDSQGRLVTSDGFPIAPEITIPADTEKINIGSDGLVSVKLAGQESFTELGSIELVNFPNPSGLSSIGRNLYERTGASGDPVAGTPGQDGLGTIAQGYLEMSNVSIMEEMVNMIIAQRAYEVNSKAMQTADEMMRLASNVKR